MGQILASWQRVVWMEISFQICFWRIAPCGPLSPLHCGYEIWWKSFLNEPKHWILKCMHHFKEACSWTPCSCMTWWSAVPLFTSWHHPHVKSNEKSAVATHGSMALKCWNPIRNQIHTWHTQHTLHTYIRCIHFMHHMHTYIHRIHRIHAYMHTSHAYITLHDITLHYIHYMHYIQYIHYIIRIKESCTKITYTHVWYQNPFWMNTGTESWNACIISRKRGHGHLVPAWLLGRLFRFSHHGLHMWNPMKKSLLQHGIHGLEMVKNRFTPWPPHVKSNEKFVFATRNPWPWNA